MLSITSSQQDAPTKATLKAEPIPTSVSRRPMTVIGGVAMIKFTAPNNVPMRKVLDATYYTSLIKGTKEDSSLKCKDCRMI